MTPFKVELFYNRNEYLRILDFLEGDTDIPDDLLDSFIEGIREQVGEVGFEEPIHVGSVAATSDGVFVRWGTISDKPWISVATGQRVWWSEFSDRVTELVK